MKKGFFALLLTFLLINPVFSSDLKVGESKLDIKVSSKNMPSVDGHELEEFWDRIQGACESPDEAGNQLPPENVMVQCLRRTSLWAQTLKGLSYDLPNDCEIDAWVYCDKDIGQMHGNFPQSLCPDHGASIDPVPGTHGANDLQPPEEIDNIICTSYGAYIYWEFSQEQGLTCEDIEGVESIEEYCANMLDNDPDVWTADANKVVEFCEINGDPIVELPVQPLPPEIPAPVTCDDVDWPNEPMPDQCCNGVIQPVALVCEKVCNAYTPGNQPKYCCDGTVPGSGVSTPEEPSLPAICDIKPKPLMSVLK